MAWFGVSKKRKSTKSQEPRKGTGYGTEYME